jgi:hypothetical protein
VRLPAGVTTTGKSPVQPASWQRIKDVEALLAR